MNDRKHTLHDRLTLQNSFSLNIMNPTYFQTRSLLLSILLILLLGIIVLPIHGRPATIVLFGKMAFLREMPNLSAVVTWKVSVVWWVVGTNTSSIRLMWIGRSCSGSDR